LLKRLQIETGMAEKSRQTCGKSPVWFGEIERKLAKLSKTTFTYRSSFYDWEVQLQLRSVQAISDCCVLLKRNCVPKSNLLEN
jgi:hypothetical protein